MLKIPSLNLSEKHPHLPLKKNFVIFFSHPALEDFKNYKHKNKTIQVLYDSETKLIWTCALDKVICAWDDVLFLLNI